MAKKMKSKKQLKYGKNTGLSLFNPDEELADPDFIKEALLECIATNDLEAFKEILGAHLRVINKEKFAKVAGVSLRTLFRMIEPESNPRLSNVAKVIEKISPHFSQSLRHKRFKRASRGLLTGKKQ